ncbi:hypothetical protein [Aureimonas sp. ME7]|uniref:hypothetical protein n=1 Tax=Aureimonas sp. ME7 TaxID=2744252 RepID=UPI0015F4DB7D|nr:hypothetical protein [Aureimonas sp. ME7]
MAGALVRALLLFGPLAAALAFGVAPRSGGDRLVASNGAEGIDTMSTGSVSSSRFTFAIGSAPVIARPAGCLYFPDGTQRGAC